MRSVTVKYAGECQKCDATIPVGAVAVYERHVGIFCPACAPSDPEEIREYRQDAADRKAERYEEWAGKREEKAMAVLNHNRTFTNDHAFNTQPGHIPERARVNDRADKAYEHTNTARRFRGKAKSLRTVKVAGDAERKRETKRELTRAWIEKGMQIISPFLNECTVTRVNKKTATIQTSSGFRCTEDLSWLTPANPDAIDWDAVKVRVSA